MTDITHFGSRKRPYIIAEIGNNHLGDVDLAHSTIDAAIQAGVDAVKFQLYDPNLLITSSEPVLKHVPNNTFDTQRERFRHMVLEHREFSALADHAKEKKVDFLCTPFDEPSADFLDDIVPAFKIASGDASNFGLIDYVATKGKPMMASTGLCEQDEVDQLVGRLPKDQSIIFHCVGAYPTPDNEVNMDLIPFYQNRYGLPVGFSDHTPDTLAPLAAIAMGATIIEKHFILDKSLLGGDRALSLDENEMRILVEGARRIGDMRGVTPRTLTESEAYGKGKLRRSVYVKHFVTAGEVITADDTVYLRPELSDAHTISSVIAAKKTVAKTDILAETALTPLTCELS